MRGLLLLWPRSSPKCGSDLVPVILMGISAPALGRMRRRASELKVKTGHGPPCPYTVGRPGIGDHQLEVVYILVWLRRRALLLLRFRAVLARLLFLLRPFSLLGMPLTLLGLSLL